MNTAVVTPAVSSAWRAVDFFILLIVALFLLLATRSILVPEASAIRFGLPLHDLLDVSFVRVYGTRNMALALLIGWLTITHQRDVLRVVFILLMALPVADMLIVSDAHGWPKVPVFHYLTVAIFLGINIWLRNTKG